MFYALYGLWMAWEVRDYIPEIVMPEYTPMDYVGILGLSLVTVGLIALAANATRGWMKRRGEVHMILTDRNDKLHDLLLTILCDGLEEACLKGEISAQELLKAYEELQKRLGLNDLVPKKRMQQIVKKSLKADRAKREQARREGKGKTPPAIPGEKPSQEVVMNSYSQTLGKGAKFLNRNAA